MHRFQQFLLFTLLFALLPLKLFTQINYGDGRDGNFSLNGPQTIYIDSIRAKAVGQPNSSELLIDPGHYHTSGTQGFQPNDHILIVQMIDHTDTSNMGRYMLTQVDEYDAQTSILHTVDAIPADSFHFNQDDRVQVLELPLFESMVLKNNVEITCHEWDGHTGGVIALKAMNQLQMTPGSKFNAQGKGPCNPNSGGEGGEGGDGGEGGTAPPSSNHGADGNDSRNGYGPVATIPGGQLLDGTDMVSGGCGANGGVGYKGDQGTDGQKATPYPSPKPYFLRMGEAGDGGDGGKGAQGGGGGGSGGNGYHQGEDGEDGEPGETGGDGGDGGCGAGVIFVAAKNIFDYSDNAVFWIKGGKGKKGKKGGTGGYSGAGGDGGNGGCQNGKAYGAGGGGGYGKRGDGGEGGEGGQVGAGGTIVYEANNFENFTNTPTANAEPGDRERGGYGGSFVNSWPSNGNSHYFYTDQCHLSSPCPGPPLNNFNQTDMLFCNSMMRSKCFCDSVYHKLMLTDSVSIEGKTLVFTKNDPENNYRVDCKYCHDTVPATISCIEKFFDSPEDNNPKVKFHGCSISPKEDCNCLFTDIADYLFDLNCEDPPCFNYENENTIDFKVSEFIFTDTTGMLTNHPSGNLFCSNPYDCYKEFSPVCDSFTVDTCCDPPPEVCYDDSACTDDFEEKCDGSLTTSGCNLVSCCECPVPTGSPRDCPMAGACGDSSQTNKSGGMFGKDHGSGDGGDEACESTLQEFFAQIQEAHQNRGTTNATISLPDDFSGMEGVDEVPEECWPCNGDLDKEITYNPQQDQLNYADDAVHILENGDSPSTVELCDGGDGGGGDIDCIQTYLDEVNDYFDDQAGTLSFPEAFFDPPDGIEPLPEDCLPCPPEEIDHDITFSERNHWEVVEDNGSFQLHRIDRNGNVVETKELCNEGDDGGNGGEGDLDCIQTFLDEVNDYFGDEEGTLSFPEAFFDPPEGIEPLPEDCLPCPPEEIDQDITFSPETEWQIIEEGGEFYLQKVDRHGNIVEIRALCNNDGEETSCLQTFFNNAAEYFGNSERLAENGGNGSGGESEEDLLILPEHFTNPPEGMDPLPEGCELPCPIDEIEHELEYQDGFQWKVVEEDGHKLIQIINEEGEIIDQVELCN